MEVGRRFGNQVGDPIAARAPDIRGDTTAQGFFCDRLQPTSAAWRGQVLAYVDAKKAGSFAYDPFFLSARPGKRVWLEFFLAGPMNAGEDVSRYLRSIPGDMAAISWTRRTTDQVRFRVYHTAGVTGTPAVMVASLGIADRLTGTPTAAQFRYLTGPLVGGHSFQIRPVDAAGNERTGCAILTGVWAPNPLPPTGVEVAGYVKTTGVVTLKWSKPSDDTVGDKYRVFKSPSSGQPVQYAAAVKSAISPVPTVAGGGKVFATFALGFTGPNAAGEWLAAVRHKRSTTEEDNVSALARFVIARDGRWSATGMPLAPTYVTVEQRPGGRLVVLWKHDSLAEPNPTKRFAIFRGPGTSGSTSNPVNYATAIGYASRVGGRFFQGTAGFVLTDGMLYRLGVRSQATGSVREINTAYAEGRADATPPTSCADSAAVAKVVG